MSDQAVFRRDGDHYFPSPFAIGPWRADRLHGGPILGLLTRALQAELPDPELVIARLTFDLFRPVPVAPLQVRVARVQQGGRLVLLEAVLSSAEADYARATALALRTSDAPSVRGTAAVTVLPGSLTTEPLFRGVRRQDVPPGFHTMIQTRWVPRADPEPLAIWFHLPMPLVAGEPETPLQRAAAVSDFTNAIASIASQWRSTPVPYINADATLYLWRAPVGDWFCLQEHSADAESGISVSEVFLHDVNGPFGRSQQARLANAVKR